MTNQTYTHNHDVINVINSAATGQGWAKTLINEAFYAVFEDYDQVPEDLSIHDQDLIDTLNNGWNIIANEN
jgi:hypothetical protein